MTDVCNDGIILDTDGLRDAEPINISVFTRGVILRKIQSIIKNENRRSVITYDDWIRTALQRTDSTQFRDYSNDDLLLIRPFTDHIMCVKGAWSGGNRILCWMVLIYETQIVCQYMDSYKDELNEVLSGLVVI